MLLQFSHPHPLLHVTMGVTFHCCSRMPASWPGVMARAIRGLTPPFTSASCMHGPGAAAVDMPCLPGRTPSTAAEGAADMSAACVLLP